MSSSASVFTSLHVCLRHDAAMTCLTDDSEVARCLINTHVLFVYNVMMLVCKTADKTQRPCIVYLFFSRPALYNLMKMLASDALCMFLCGTPATDSYIADACVVDRLSWTSPIGGSDEHTYLDGDAPGMRHADCIVKTKCFYSNRTYTFHPHSVWYYPGGILARHGIPFRGTG